jgi:hypothetical protein
MGLDPSRCARTAVGWALAHHPIGRRAWRTEAHPTADFAGVSSMQIRKSFLVLFFKKEQRRKHFFFEKKKQKTFEYKGAHV